MMKISVMVLVTFLDTLMMTVYVSAKPKFITVITSGLTTFTYFDFCHLEHENSGEIFEENGNLTAPLCVPESDSVRMIGKG